MLPLPSVFQLISMHHNFHSYWSRKKMHITSASNITYEANLQHDYIKVHAEKGLKLINTTLFGLSIQ